MQPAQLFNNAAAASAHCHHLQNGRLCAVVGVLGAPLALCDPYVVVLFFYDEMHVIGHQAAGHERLARRQSAPYDERLVHPHKVFHPRQGQQVIADCNLACGLEAVVYQQLVKETGIKHNVTVVAYERVTPRHVNRRYIHVAPGGELVYQRLHETITKLYLELQVGLA